MSRTILRGPGRWLNRIVKSTLGTKRKLAALSGMVALFLVAGTLAFALIPDTGGVIHACYNNQKGNLRVIDPALESCNDRETAISWNQTGPEGPGGADGISGADGIDGKTVLNGREAPDERVGTLGDFYLDTTDSILYGPKSEDGWGEGTSLVGPSGATGATGPAGPSSLDSLEGTTCRTGRPEAGIVRITFDSGGVATITCVPTTLFALTVTKSGSGSGTVTSDPAGINCGPTCAADFSINREVTLTAALAGQNRFAGWTGACSGTSLTCTVTMDAAKQVGAAFVGTRTLQVAPYSTRRYYTCGFGESCSVGGSGTVTSNPAGINCSVSESNVVTGVCQWSFDLNSTVTLTGTGYGTSNSCVDGCVVVMDANKYLSVRFDG